MARASCSVIIQGLRESSCANTLAAAWWSSPMSTESNLFLLKPSVVLYGTGKISPDIMIELSDRNMVFVLDDDVEKIFC